MESTARMFNCRRCGKQVLICSHCDRGHQYCSSDCAKKARQQALRKAGQRYQKSFPGRMNHALRQSRYRQRQKDKVTHHTSTAPALNALLKKQQKSSSERPFHQVSTEETPYRCSFCGRRCSEFIRLGYLQQSGRAPPAVMRL